MFVGQVLILVARCWMMLARSILFARKYPILFGKYPPFFTFISPENSQGDLPIPQPRFKWQHLIHSDQLKPRKLGQKTTDSPCNAGGWEKRGIHQLIMVLCEFVRCFCSYVWWYCFINTMHLADKHGGGWPAWVYSMTNLSLVGYNPIFYHEKYGV